MDSGLLAFRQYGYFVVELYHWERNHQGLGKRLIVPMTTSVETVGTVERHQRLGGLLSYYYRETA